MMSAQAIGLCRTIGIMEIGHHRLVEAPVTLLGRISKQKLSLVWYGFNLTCCSGVLDKRYTTIDYSYYWCKTWL